MKIKSIFNKGYNLPDDCLDPKGGYDKSTEFHLIINKEYIVYALTINLGYVWYYICDEAFTYYPRWNPSPLFEVTEGKISKYWIYFFEKENNYINMIMAFPEWAKKYKSFYENLVEGNEKEKKYLETIKH